MAIERKNSFHLLLSDDEFKLLRLLAERDGLNASDYLRSLLRRMAAAPSPMTTALHVRELLGSRLELARSFEGTRAATKTAKKKPARKGAARS